MDLIPATAGLILLSPLILLISLAVRVFIGSPVIFRQERAGLRAHPFTILKFRTMTDGRDYEGAFLPDDQRLTALGDFLRKTSMDELPQLWNVLKGDMSLVGPRPLPLETYNLLTPDQRRRNDVPPGIVGLPAVMGRAANPWPKRLELDLDYVDNRSLFFDTKIFFMAFRAVFDWKGVNEEGRATCSKFTRSDESKHRD